MFRETGLPRVFALAPGVDFPKAVVAGIKARLADAPPEATAQVTLIVNTARMRRRVTELFIADGPGFLPKIRLVTDLGADPGFADIPPAVSALRRRLLLSQAIDSFLTTDPTVAPRTSLFDLADSLATLMDEMQGEGVDPATIAELDVSGHSAHWRRTQDFLGIIADFLAADVAPDTQARQRIVVKQLIGSWLASPPSSPIIVAGSTGSRGTTALLMQAVARLPQGAVILPGFDWHQPPDVWAALDTAVASEDHPQYRFHALLSALNMTSAQVVPWHTASDVPNADRNNLVSLALRPAPVTDQWMRDGKTLQGLAQATADLTLIEAASPRAEALAIALILRQAAETGKKAALITPDRGLSRMVTASLDRWGIQPDDSAGQPLALSPSGRFLRQVAALSGSMLMSEDLLALLKHPITHSGAARGDHLRWTRLLEQHIRDKAQPYPTTAYLRDWATGQPDPGVGPWAKWLIAALDGTPAHGPRSLSLCLAWHIASAETLARGSLADGAGSLWDHTAGEETRRVLQLMQDEAAYAGLLSPRDYCTLFDALLNEAQPVRDSVLAHPDIMIWGTLEARVQGADLVILGGLNEGVWPGSPAPDPWLNRSMRVAAGLLLPDRQIGLAAHDFQQAVGVQTVVLSRAKRNAEAETVASRWLNRLTNLMDGLTAQDGPAHLTAMRARGEVWLQRADTLDAPLTSQTPAHRPSPRPPVGVRPTELPVTDLSRLIRDPYAIYAKRILRLKPMQPLRPTADRLLKGRVLHSALEQFGRLRMADPDVDTKIVLLALMQDELDNRVAWPVARALWFAKLERVTKYLAHLDHQSKGQPVLIEQPGKLNLPTLNFTVTARPDRIDLLPDGRVQIIDYKSGTPPTAQQQRSYDKQLLFTALIAARGGFLPDMPTDVAAISYVGLGASPKSVDTPITDAILAEHWDGLLRLIATYQRRSTGYTARRALFLVKDHSDYDHLSRFGEWTTGDASVPEVVGTAE